MSKRKRSVTTLSGINNTEREALEKIAIQHGCSWGDKPNVSRLLKRIANGDLIVIDPQISSRLIPEKEELQKNLNAIKAVAEKALSLLSKQNYIPPDDTSTEPTHLILYLHPQGGVEQVEGTSEMDAWRRFYEISETFAMDAPKSIAVRIDDPMLKAYKVALITET